jgi:hypothetical protein
MTDLEVGFVIAARVSGLMLQGDVCKGRWRTQQGKRQQGRKNKFHG